MKKIALLFCLICLCTLTFAEGRMQVMIDYSNGIYRGLLYDRIIVDEPDFIKDKPRYETRFMNEFQDNYNGAAYLTEEIDETDDIVTIRIIKVSPKGYVTADVFYGNKIIRMEGKGGVFGTFLNLFGDGMQSLGRDIALWLNTICSPTVSNPK